MFVRVVPLSQPSSKSGLLYVKCLCELSRYPSPVVEIWICCMLNVCAELSRYHSPVVDLDLLYVKCLCEFSRYHSPVWICCMLNVCLSCPVIAQ